MSKRSWTLDEVRRDMLAHHELLIEETARHLAEESGCDIDVCRALARSNVEHALPLNTRSFLAGGGLPKMPD